MPGPAQPVGAVALGAAGAGGITRRMRAGLAAAPAAGLIPAQRRHRRHPRRVGGSGGAAPDRGRDHRAAIGPGLAADARPRHGEGGPRRFGAGGGGADRAVAAGGRRRDPAGDAGCGRPVAVLAGAIGLWTAGNRGWPRHGRRTGHRLRDCRPGPGTRVEWRGRRGFAAADRDRRTAPPARAADPRVVFRDGARAQRRAAAPRRRREAAAARSAGRRGGDRRLAGRRCGNRLDRRHAGQLDASKAAGSRCCWRTRARGRCRWRCPLCR